MSNFTKIGTGLMAMALLVTNASGQISKQALFLQHDENPNISSYKKLLPIPANNPAEEIDIATVNSGTGQVEFGETSGAPRGYLTDPGFPGTTAIPAGIWNFNTWLSVDNSSGITEAVIHVYKHSSSGMITELFNVTTARIIGITPNPQLIQTQYTQETDIALDPTDRILVRYFAQTTAGSNRTASLYYEGSLHASYIITPLPVVGAVGATGATGAGTTGTTSTSGKTKAK